MSTRKYSSTSREQLAESLFDIAATRGLDAASVREVATGAGVSIGAVQHHFATKDDMFLFAFTHVVDRVRARIDTGNSTGTLTDRLTDALSQLLPLDDERDREARVMTAFAVRAANSDTLGSVQRDTLAAIRAELTDILRAARIAKPELRATLLLAIVDGLTLDALSSSGLYDAAQLTDALTEQIRLVIGND
ncbi:TetR/AcrR family transcriptional regulator [Antrihabitans cavernicola]|uniref:TetR family transcriptional regulator n=1 Tax=Antrihabitans cavernicola TaxID=2495913 RepID=A0A5A7SG40_9NOCA|nr:TetR/AcrR family transcriptional regulator [Spelaeibacter cavernicola]KAA0024544.1 TetR family transcriptional regulator [Spelaeibacter cavernicola]